MSRSSCRTLVSFWRQSFWSSPEFSRIETKQMLGDGSKAFKPPVAFIALMDRSVRDFLYPSIGDIGAVFEAAQLVELSLYGRGGVHDLGRPTNRSRMTERRSVCCAIASFGGACRSCLGYRSPRADAGTAGSTTGFIAGKALAYSSGLCKRWKRRWRYTLRQRSEDHAAGRHQGMPVGSYGAEADPHEHPLGQRSFNFIVGAKAPGRDAPDAMLATYDIERTALHRAIMIAPETKWPFFSPPLKSLHGKTVNLSLRTPPPALNPPGKINPPVLCPC